MMQFFPFLPKFPVLLFAIPVLYRHHVVSVLFWSSCYWLFLVWQSFFRLILVPRVDFRHFSFIRVIHSSFCCYPWRRASCCWSKIWRCGSRSTCSPGRWGSPADQSIASVVRKVPLLIAMIELVRNAAILGWSGGWRTVVEVRYRRVEIYSRRCGTAYRGRNFPLRISTAKWRRSSPPPRPRRTSGRWCRWCRTYACSWTISHTVGSLGLRAELSRKYHVGDWLDGDLFIELEEGCMLYDHIPDL